MLSILHLSGGLHNLWDGLITICVVAFQKNANAISPCFELYRLSATHEHKSKLLHNRDLDHQCDRESGVSFKNSRIGKVLRSTSMSVK